MNRRLSPVAAAVLIAALNAVLWLLSLLLTDLDTIHRASAVLWPLSSISAAWVVLIVWPRRPRRV